MIVVFGSSSFLLLVYSMRHVTDGKNDDTGVILFGVTIQAIAMITVVSLLIIKHHSLTEADEKDIEATEKRIEAVEKEIKNYTDELLQALKDEPFGQKRTLELLTEAAIQDPAISAKLQPGEQAILKKLIRIRQRLDKPALDVAILEKIARRWKITMDRIVIGFIFLIICVVSSALPIYSDLFWAKPTNPISSSYLSLASISSVCASSAYALLGRRKTDEIKFLEDLSQVNSTLNILKEIAGQGLKLRK